MVDRNKSGCSIYISQILNTGNRNVNLPKTDLESAVINSEPTDTWNIHQTTYGLVVSFSSEADADKLIGCTNFSDIFQCPVQVNLLFHNYTLKKGYFNVVSLI